MTIFVGKRLHHITCCKRPFIPFTLQVAAMTLTHVIIITGYLGSGKTTLLKRIVDQAEKRIAILMNEFGEFSIDSAVIKGKNIDMIELAGGCVCCSLTGELEAAIKEIRATIQPDMIVIETTG